MEYFQSALGITVFIVIAFFLSENKKAFPFKLVGLGLITQIVLALLFTKIPFLSDAFFQLNKVTLALNTATAEGSQFMFGFLAGKPLSPEAHALGIGGVLAFQILPIVLVTSAFSAVLFHWGLLQKLVNVFAWLLKKSLGAGGALGLGVAANVFLGIIEAPLIIRPYLKRMTRSELFTMLTAGMATIAGTVLVLYSATIDKVVPGALGQILLASIISAPAAIMLAQIIIPMELDKKKSLQLEVKKTSQSTLDALIQGTFDGLNMVLNIVAVIIVLFASVSIINQVLSIIPLDSPLRIQDFFSWLFTPLVWLMGIPWSEAVHGASLMATKTVLNEYVAYSQLAGLEDGTLSERSRVIMTFALCGFANFGSLGILIGGLGTILPERRQEIIELGIKAIIAGTLSTMTTGSIISFLM
jgi:CNT family concentrative nucleoside transporter